MLIIAKLCFSVACSSRNGLYEASNSLFPSMYIHSTSRHLCSPNNNSSKGSFI